MVRYLMKKTKPNAGLTIVEVVSAMAIAAIAFTGMLYTYTEGVRYTRQNSSKMVLYNEGSAALSKMSKAIRLCGRARIKPFGGVSNAKLDMAYAADWGGGAADFYFNELGENIKWNDRRRGTNKLNMTLLPMLDFNTGHGEEPYLKVKDLTFTDLDHIGTPSPYIRGFSLIRIELVLEDDRGDTLYLSTVSSKRNKL